MAAVLDLDLSRMRDGRQRTRPGKAEAPRIARVYLRVSTDEQDLRRQEALVENARAAGYYVAAVYRE